MRTTFTRCTTCLAVLMALSACDAEGLFEDIGASLADGEEINVEASTSTGEEVDISIAADDDGGIDVDVVISGDTDGDGGPTDPEPPEPITPEPPEPITPEPPEPENVSPTADFSSPANGAQIVAGSPVFVSVVAADSDGVIDNVALSVDGTFIREEFVSEYEWDDDVLQSLSVGTHELTAVATDNDGATTTISITVEVIAEEEPPEEEPPVEEPPEEEPPEEEPPVEEPPVEEPPEEEPPVEEPPMAENSLPEVSFSSPVDGATVETDSVLAVTVDATDSDGSVDNVTLSVDGNLVRQENASPYEWGEADSALQNLAPGTHQLTAVATDDAGDSTEETITITVVESEEPTPPPPPEVAEGVLTDETIDGDISSDLDNPLAFQLTDGSGTIIGSVGAGDTDYVTVNVPEGSVLSAINLLDYVNVDPGTVSFIGVQEGTVFTELPDDPNVGNLLGFLLYGAELLDTNILPAIGEGPGTQGFTGPLGAGDYTFWINETADDPSSYSFEFVVSAEDETIEEPPVEEPPVEEPPEEEPPVEEPPEEEPPVEEPPVEELSLIHI